MVLDPRHRRDEDSWGSFRADGWGLGAAEAGDGEPGWDTPRSSDALAGRRDDLDPLDMTPPPGRVPGQEVFVSASSQTREKQGAETGGPASRSTRGDGRRIGPYKLGKRLGGGNTGAVFEATHATGGSRVAIKRFIPQLARHEAAGKAYIFEAGRVSRYRVQAIIPVRQLVVKGRETCLVYPLVAGTNLLRLWRKKRTLAVGRATGIAIELCDALRAAHANGSVHGFLTPERVITTRDGEHTHVRLAGFGLAAALAALPRGREPKWCRELLRSPFVAPEIRVGTEVGTTADVYGVGAVFYHMLLGRLPKRGLGARKDWASAGLGAIVLAVALVLGLLTNTIPAGRT